MLIYQTCFFALHEVVSGSGFIYLLFFLSTLLNMGEWSVSRFASLPARPSTLRTGGSEVPGASLSLLRSTKLCFHGRESNHIFFWSSNPLWRLLVDLLAEFVCLFRLHSL